MAPPISSNIFAVSTTSSLDMFNQNLKSFSNKAFLGKPSMFIGLFIVASKSSNLAPWTAEAVFLSPAIIAGIFKINDL